MDFEVLDVGNGGKAQSRFAEYSGLGGGRSNKRGTGAVALRNGGPLLPLPLLECLLDLGEAGDCGRGNGPMNGSFATAVFSCGGAVRGGFGSVIGIGGTGGCKFNVGARALFCGGDGGGDEDVNCKGDGCAGFDSPIALSWRSVKGLLRLAEAELGDAGAFVQT